MRVTLGAFGIIVIVVMAFFTDAQAAPCFTNTLGGTYVYTIAGVGPDGYPRSELGVVNVSPANINGMGTYSGTGFLSLRGFEPESGPTSGTYQIFSNCFNNFAAPAGRFLGYASDGGAFIQFASPFDTGTQLTGVARRVQ